MIVLASETFAEFAASASMTFFVLRLIGGAFGSRGFRCLRCFGASPGTGSFGFLPGFFRGGFSAETIPLPRTALPLA